MPRLRARETRRGTVPSNGPIPKDEASRLIWGDEKSDTMAAFCRGGEIHKEFIKYRATCTKDGRPNKLHTAAYVYRPKKGESGEEYTYSLVWRAGEFARLAHLVHALIFPPKQQGSQAKKRPRKITKDCVDCLLQTQSGVGPTMSKMFLVSTHLRYPHLGLVSDTCQVGDGAAAAFTHLYPNASPTQNREALLVHLLDELKTHAEHVEPRLLPMVEWTARRTAEAFKGIIPKELFRDRITAFELQVNLCEWRKYRNMDLPRKRKQPKVPKQCKPVGKSEAAQPKIEECKPVGKPEVVQPQPKRWKAVSKSDVNQLLGIHPPTAAPAFMLGGGVAPAK